ncbi:MAG: methyltransferase domain-containing protein [Streptosporangiales bacterium]|nr:methyltransferase domain-containing protein [Streptosporangiales bacterium]
MSFADRRFFGDTRQWICQRAAGDVLEVAIGTGLNLPWYPADVRLTGVELSPGMLAQARQRAVADDHAADLRLGDAQQLRFEDESFDTVVCTFSLCAIPDAGAAVREMVRVLRPGGLVLLADHVVSTSRPVRVLQRLVELVTIRTGGEHYTRRPMDHVRNISLTIEDTDRFKLGVVERLAARKPA